MVSKNNPSLVLAFPMVPQATSFPLIEKLEALIPSTCLKTLEACASPNKRGI